MPGCFAFVCAMVWGVVILSAIVATFIWLDTVTNDDLSAPQLAAEMATTAVFVIVPYIFARALTEIVRLVSEGIKGLEDEEGKG